MLDKIESIYNSMLGVGMEVQKVLEKGKGEKAVNEILQRESLDNLPAQEDLLSVIGADQQTLGEYLEFVSPPDILLEKELCWPVEPDLDY